jgi:hypothetical protein
MKQFGVKFGDNDFYITFAKLLPDIAESIFIRRDGEISKLELCKLINLGVTGYYYVNQNPLSYEDNANITKYLQVREEQIYIDEELDNLLRDKKYFRNGELFCVTLPEKYNSVGFWSV